MRQRNCPSIADRTGLNQYSAGSAPSATSRLQQRSPARGRSHRLCFRRALPKDASKRLLRPQRTQRPSCYEGTVTGDFDVHVEVASVEGVHFAVFSAVESKTMYRKPLLLFKLEEEAA